MLKKTKKYLSQIKNEQAFSLVELIIIIVVIGISIVPLTTLIRTNQRGIGDLSLTIQAEFFTQSVMEELIADYRGQGYDYVITNWTGITKIHPNLSSMTASVGIAENTDTDTGIQYADVVVQVDLDNGFTTRLVCQIVDESS